MPARQTLLSMARVVIAWAAFMTLVGIALTLIPVRAPDSIELPPFRILLFACVAFVLHIAYDYWEKSHRVSTFLTVVVLSAVTGALLGRLMWSRALDDGVVLSGTVVFAHTSSSPSGSSSLEKASNSGGTSRAAVKSPSPETQGVVSAISRPDLSVAHEPSPTHAQLGMPVKHRFIVWNRGPVTASRVQLTDRVSGTVDKITAAANRGTCVVRARLVTCGLGDIPPGGTASLEVVSAPRQPGSLRHAVTVTAREDDASGANNSVVVTTSIRSAEARGLD